MTEDGEWKEMSKLAEKANLDIFAHKCNQDILTGFEPTISRLVGGRPATTKKKVLFLKTNVRII